MRIKLLKIFFIAVALLYQLNAHSKTLEKSEFNHRYLSSYFSALVSLENQQNKESLKFFNHSRSLINFHKPYVKNYKKGRCL